MAAVFLFLALLTLYVILERGLITSLGEAIIAAFVVGGATLLGISELLSATVEQIVVDADTVQMRDRLGRHVRVARSEISHAALISSFEPPQFVVRLNDLLLVGTNGRCLLRVPEPDYGTEAIERLVGTLGVHQPHERISTRRQVRREFPGAYAFDYLAVGIFIIVILAMALALASFNGLLR